MVGEAGLVDLWLGPRVEDGDGLVVDEERPFVVNVHRTGVGDVDVAGDFSVVQNASKINLTLLKAQVRKVNLATEGYLILRQVSIRRHRIHNRLKTSVTVHMTAL